MKHADLIPLLSSALLALDRDELKAVFRDMGRQSAARGFREFESAHGRLVGVRPEDLVGEAWPPRCPGCHKPPSEESS